MSHPQSIAGHFYFDFAKLPIPFFVRWIKAQRVVRTAILKRGPNGSVYVVLSIVSATACPACNVIHGEVQKLQVCVSGGELVNQLCIRPWSHRPAGTCACVRQTICRQSLGIDWV